jgi:MFS family permease
MPPSNVPPAKAHSVHALEATNFFLADVQTGLGPFVAAYLAANGWKAGRVGHALTVAGIVTVLLQTPAGWLVDRISAKRALLITASIVLGVGAILLTFSTSPATVYLSEVLIGGTGPFLGPTLAAITMGIVGFAVFDRQFGRNQGFNSAGNLFAAALIAAVSRLFDGKGIFIATAALVIPTILATLMIRPHDIDPELARGGRKQTPSKPSSKPEAHAEALLALLQDKVLLVFLLCCFLFHLANAAMLPQLGELLAHGSARKAAPFMSACIAVTQTVIMLSAAWIGRRANLHGRKPLLVVGFGILPLRALLYTIVHSVAALIAVQVLDGVANAIFGVVSILVVADRTRGTGRFNLTQGAIATAVALGAALSTTLGGTLMEHHGANVSFWTLGAVALLAFVLLLTAIPETRITTPKNSPAPAPSC